MKKIFLHTPRWLGLQLVLPCLILILTTCCFAPILQNGFVFDDFFIFDLKICQSLSINSIIHFFTTPYSVRYQPLTTLSLSIDYAMGKDNPQVYHTSSLILHLINTLLFYWLVLTLFRHIKGMLSPRSYWIAGAVTLLFAIHPLRVEAVAWISGRADLLCASFYFSTILVYLKMLEKKANDQRWITWYLFSLFLFILSLLSKAWGITFPIILLALDIAFYKVFPSGQKAFSPWGSMPKMLLAKLPYLVFALLIMVVAISIKEVQEQNQAVPVMERFCLSIYGIGFYLSKTIVPYPLTFFYTVKDPHLVAFALCSVAILLITGVCLKLWPKRPALFLAWMSYISILLPVLAHTQGGSQLVSDRYTYIACLPIMLLAYGFLDSLFLKHDRYKLPLACCLILILALFGKLTMEQSKIWQNQLSLWLHLAKVEDDNIFALENLNVEYNKMGKYEEAKIISLHILQLDPENYTAAYGLALALTGLHEDEKAIMVWKKLQARKYFQPGKPFNDGTYLEIAKNLGLLYQRQKKWNLAIEEFHKMLELDPENPDAYNFLGEISEAQGNSRQAKEFWQKAVKHFPLHRAARKNLARSPG